MVFSSLCGTSSFIWRVEFRFGNSTFIVVVNETLFWGKNSSIHGFPHLRSAFILLNMIYLQTLALTLMHSSLKVSEGFIDQKRQNQHDLRPINEFQSGTKLFCYGVPEGVLRHFLASFSIFTSTSDRRPSLYSIRYLWRGLTSHISLKYS